MICSRGHKEALYTITKSESQKFKSTIIIKKKKKKKKEHFSFCSSVNSVWKNRESTLEEGSE